MGDAVIRNILISPAVMRAAGILVAHSKLGGRRRTGLPITIERSGENNRNRKLNACPPPRGGCIGHDSIKNVNGRPGKRATWHSTIGHADGGPRQRDGAANVDEYRELAWLVVLPTTSSPGDQPEE